MNLVDPLGLDTYYINNEFNNPNPTDNTISHSFVATTDIDSMTGLEFVVDTYSWTDERGGSWHKNENQNLIGARKAVSTNIGLEKWGNEALDKYITLQYLKIQNNQGGYNLFFNNCKENANALIIAAINQMNSNNQTDRIDK